MFKLKLAAVAAATLLTGLMSASGAQAADYSDPVISVNFAGGDQTVAGGSTLSGTASSGGTDCAWTATFNGESDEGSGDSFSFSFTVPTEPGEYPLVITCAYENGITGSSATVSNSSSVQPAFYVQGANTAVPAAVVTASKTFTITVVAAAGGGNGGTDQGAGAGLPDTGGSNVAYVGAGAALLILGAGIVFVARRKTGLTS